MVTVRVRVRWGQRRTPLGKMSVTRVCSIVAVLLHEVCVLLGAVLFFQMRLFRRPCILCSTQNDRICDTVTRVGEEHISRGQVRPHPGGGAPAYPEYLGTPVPTCMPKRFQCFTHSDEMVTHVGE